MDTRRFLIAGIAGLLQAGCAAGPASIAGEPLASTSPFAMTASAVMPEAAPTDTSVAPGPAGQDISVLATSGLEVQQVAFSPYVSATARPYLDVLAASWERDVAGAGPVQVQAQGPAERRRALGAANAAARAVSPDDSFVGGVRVFAWAPGRVYEIWTSPLRVTTLTLSPGETLLAKAAGDTVRWQIGDATSGEGSGARTHVMLKPLQRDLSTNLILTTNRRVYLIELRSGGSDAFNTAVTWEPQASAMVAATPPPDTGPAPSLIDPEAVIDAGYSIEVQGARQLWTPTSVFNDGRRTFITFPQAMQFDEAPALFVIARDGERQMVNYRQVGGLFIVDRVLERAELRLGDRRPRIVRILRAGSQP